MLKKILLAALFVIATVLAYAAVSPSEYKISRKIVIAANAETIFPYINNQAKAGSWMPWKEIDPDVQVELAGPPEGVGSIMKWTSKGQMGTGQAEVVESLPGQSVTNKLTYAEPMIMEQTSTITLLPHAEAVGSSADQPDKTVTIKFTQVLWEVTGQNTFIARLMCLFVDMDKIVGQNFEKGLANLKRLVESPPTTSEPAPSGDGN